MNIARTKTDMKAFLAHILVGPIQYEPLTRSKHLNAYSVGTSSGYFKYYQQCLTLLSLMCSPIFFIVVVVVVFNCVCKNIIN